MSELKNKKIAVVHDHLGWSGGGERTALIIAMDLGADFISAYAGEKCFPDYQLKLGKRLLLFTDKVVDLEVVRFFWLRFLFWKNRKIFKKYDILIASGQVATEVVAHYAKKSALKILYNHTPPRRIYDLYEDSRRRYKWFLRPLFTIFTKYWHFRYIRALKKIDVDIANSKNIKKRMLKYTGFDVDYVLPPPIVEKFKYIKDGDYFLSYARVDEHKRVDLIVKAFARMPDKKLIVASSGSEIEKVKKLAEPYKNIDILGWVSDERLVDLVGSALAVIYIPINEDAGMTQLEANLAGKPVLGVYEGGLKETIIEGKTGIFVPSNPGIDDVILATKKMTPEWCRSRKDFCIQHAQKYNRKIFIKKLKKIIDENLPDK